MCVRVCVCVCVCVRVRVRACSWGAPAWCQIPDGWKRKSPGRNVTYKWPQSFASPDALSYPTPHGIPRGPVTHAATSSISASAVGDDLNAGCPPSAMPSAKSELLSAAPIYRDASANAAVHTVSAAQRVHVPAAAAPL